MRIIIYVHKLYGGGAEHVAAMWANGFFNRGHNVKIIVNERNKNDFFVDDDIEICTIKHSGHIKFFRQINQIYNIRREVKIFNPDVIITLLYPCGLYTYLATLGLNIPIINTEHNSFERPASAWVQHNKIKKIYLNKLYNHVTVLTQADKEVIGNRLKNISVLPNPLALTPVREMPDKKKIILAIGRLDAWHSKGFDVLIKAWAKIANKTEGWKLQIAGASQKNGLKFLKDLCAEKGVTDSVEFLGYQKDILPYYKDASIFVLSSRYEGFGLVLIEAMSQGCACVACDYKGRQKEIMPSGCEGVTCEPENIDELSNAMIELIKDDYKRKMLSNNGIHRSSYYAIDNIMDIWERILNIKN